MKHQPIPEDIRLMPHDVFKSALLGSLRPDLEKLLEFPIYDEMFCKKLITFMEDVFKAEKDKKRPYKCPV